MEAPNPFHMLTPKDNNIDNMIDIKSFNIQIDKNNFIFEVGKSFNKNNIIFKINKLKPELSKTSYLLTLNLNEFHDKNAIFSLYKNIEEIYDFLCNIMKDKKFSTTIKDDKIILIFQIPMYGGKIIGINFELNEVKINNDDLIEQTNSIIKNLIKENKSIKNEIKEIKEELNIKNKELENLKICNNNIINENSQIKKRLEKLEDYIKIKSYDIPNNLINQNNIEYNNFFDFDKSNIFKNNKEKSKVLEWISEKGKIKKINLLFKSKEDGDRAATFYNKCSCKGPTLSLIKNKKGVRLGGFTKREWKNEDIILKDQDAFLFSLDYLEKYKILKPDYAIGCTTGRFYLIFGNNLDGCGIYLCEDREITKYMPILLLKENHSTKVYDIPSNYYLTGESCSEVQEIEVFQIIF